MWVPCVFGALRSADWPSTGIFLLYVDFCRIGRKRDTVEQSRRREIPLNPAVCHRATTLSLDLKSQRFLCFQTLSYSPFRLGLTLLLFRFISFIFTWLAL